MANVPDAARERRLRRRARLATALVAVGVAGTIGAGVAVTALASDPTTIACAAPTETREDDAFATPQSTNPVVRYAPLVFLGRGEKLRPMSAECYLANASLMWSREGTRTEVAAVGEIDAASLGKGQYEERLDGRVYKSSDYTRPHDKKRPDAGALDASGFFLDATGPAHAGAQSAVEGVLFAGTPAYFDYAPGRYVTYWLFYGYSAPLGLADPPRFDGFKPIGHEADWESITIRLGENDEPLEVAYFQHGVPEVLPWARAPKLDGHPIAFSATGSHASYSRQGDHRTHVDAASVGSLWATWNFLLDARLQPWYGYGGAWGAPPRPSRARARRISALKRTLPSFARRRLERFGPSDFTGPVGPSNYKTAVPCPQWLTGASCPQRARPRAPSRGRR